MTGGGTRQMTSDEVRERVKIVSFNDFEKYVEPLGIRGNNGATEIYGKFTKLLTDIGYEDVSLAKNVQQNILSTIGSAESAGFVRDYIDECCDRKIRNKLLVSRHYKKISGLPEPVSHFLFYVLNLNRDDDAELENRMEKESPFSEDLEYLPIVNSLGEKLSEVSLSLYITIRESIKKMKDGGETEDTIKKFLEKTVADTHDWKDLKSILTFSNERSTDILNRVKGIVLDDFKGELGFFAGAMTGVPLQVGYVAYGEQAYFDGTRINLPAAAPKNTSEDARAFYRAATAHQAGQVEFGTFDIDVEKIKDLTNGLRRKYGRRKKT